jgi:hypothetical protein
MISEGSILVTSDIQQWKLTCTTVEINLTGLIQNWVSSERKQSRPTDMSHHIPRQQLSNRFRSRRLSTGLLRSSSRKSLNQHRKLSSRNPSSPTLPIKCLPSSSRCFAIVFLEPWRGYSLVSNFHCKFMGRFSVTLLKLFPMASA